MMQLPMFSPAHPERAETRSDPGSPAHPGDHLSPTPAHRLRRNRFPEARRSRTEQGATFSEVMVAMLLTSMAVLGTMAAFEAADKTLGRDALAVRALAMAASRIEAKCAVPWNLLLFDDLNHDGVPETIMRDDGAGGDRMAGDGIYSAMFEQHGVKIVWTVAPHPAGPFSSAGAVVIEARGSYAAGTGEHEIRLATLRANSAFAGSH
jgi:hypothetical protein